MVRNMFLFKDEAIAPGLERLKLQK